MLIHHWPSADAEVWIRVRDCGDSFLSFVYRLRRSPRMHHALEIQEILFNIFGHCHRGIDQASLARTCRAFKEPALDLIWEELPNLCPLAKCLPEMSYWQTSDRMVRWFQMYIILCGTLFILSRHITKWYRFSRPLMQTDWYLLQSYTRRVRRIMNFQQGLTKHSIRILSNPPTTEPLFPNLRDLRCYSGPLHRTQFFFSSLSKSSPNISRLHLHVAQSDVAFDKLVSNCICQWQNLRTVDCPEISLDTDALAHLSHMPALTQLTFKLMVTFPDRISPLLFPNLHILTLHSASMSLMLHLLSRTRLPLVHFTAFSGTCLSSQELFSILAAIQTFNPDPNIIENLSLCQTCFPINFVPLEVPLLRFADLRPCMAFSNLRYLYFDHWWNVNMTDSDLLALASAWPNLVSFMINAIHGWSTLDGSGITPNGLLQLLQTCRS
ncbi:hypothetical protein L210DRAFT_441623, partial [Boletus edulis BED1]